MNKQQAYYNLFVSQIEGGRFVLEDMLFKIEKRASEGYFTEEVRDNLRALAEEKVDPTYEIEVTQEEKITTLESRCDELEAMVFELCEYVSLLVAGEDE